MTQENRRVRRVADQIKTELAWIIDQKLKDPNKGFITLTRVKLSTDLKLARIYFSVLGDVHKQPQSEKALKKATNFLRIQLSQKLNLRYAPELQFFYDDTIEYSDHISRLLNKIHGDENNK
jgi:ribosome-binding factor A